MCFWEGFVVLQALKALENTAYKLEEESERRHCLEPIAEHKEKLTARSRSGWTFGLLWGRRPQTTRVGLGIRLKWSVEACWTHSFGFLVSSKSLQGQIFCFCFFVFFKLSFYLVWQLLQWKTNITCQHLKYYCTQETRTWHTHTRV